MCTLPGHFARRLIKIDIAILFVGFTLELIWFFAILHYIILPPVFNEMSAFANCGRWQFIKSLKVINKSLQVELCWDLYPIAVFSAGDVVQIAIPVACVAALFAICETLAPCKSQTYVGAELGCRVSNCSQVILFWHAAVVEFRPVRVRSKMDAFSSRIPNAVKVAICWFSLQTVPDIRCSRAKLDDMLAYTIFQHVRAGLWCLTWHLKMALFGLATGATIQLWKIIRAPCEMLAWERYAWACAYPLRIIKWAGQLVLVAPIWRVSAVRRLLWSREGYEGRKEEGFHYLIQKL